MFSQDFFPLHLQEYGTVISSISSKKCTHASILLTCNTLAPLITTEVHTGKYTVCLQHKTFPPYPQSIHQIIHDNVHQAITPLTVCTRDTSSSYAPLSYFHGPTTLLQAATKQPHAPLETATTYFKTNTPQVSQHEFHPHFLLCHKYVSSQSSRHWYKWRWYKWTLQTTSSQTTVDI